MAKRKAIWTAKAFAMLGTVADAKVAKILGCSHQAVSRRRLKLGIRALSGTQSREAWGNLELSLLRERRSDAELAKLLRRPVDAIAAKRRELKRETH